MNQEKEKPVDSVKSSEELIRHIDEIPEEIEAYEGVRRTVSQFNAKVTDDAGQNIIQSDAAKKVTITIPADDQILETRSKGDTRDASAWDAVFVIRLLKKAVLNGWKIIRGKRGLS